MKTGVIYQLTGPLAAPLLMVSMTSLRKVYSGPVAIAATKDCRSYAHIASQVFGNVEIVATKLLPQCSRPHFTSKAFTYLLSPFDRTVYLDADTVVLKPIDPLFRISAPLAIPRMGDQGLNDDSMAAKFFREKMERPFRQYGPVIERMLDAAIAANYPIVNAGVVSYQTSSPIMHAVHGMTLAGRRGNIDEEMVMQILGQQYPTDIKVIPQYWDHTIRYGGSSENAKILHFHRKCWSESEAYIPFWKDACETVVNLARWAPSCDKRFKGLGK